MLGTAVVVGGLLRDASEEEVGDAIDNQEIDHQGRADDAEHGNQECSYDMLAGIPEAH